jgi:6-phosphofructokinase
MKSHAVGNMVIAQSGGPSMVINQSLVGAILEARGLKHVGRILGAMHGIKGVLAEEFIDLRKESTRTLAAVAKTPASALGTVRMKPTAKDCAAIFKVLRKHDVSYFFYIGGNDSAETVHIISQAAKKGGHPISCYHIPKTIDNDLRANDHTPGFGSAAKYVACATMGSNLDNRSLPGVKIDIIMGRDAGFLTAAAALGRVEPDDGPHLLYFPERAFTLTQFAKDVEGVYKRLGRCTVALSEGIRNATGQLVAATFIKEVDSHGNAQLGGSGALGDHLATELKARTSITRVRADTFGYVQRSMPLAVSKIDAEEARAAGAAAVREAVTGQHRSGSIALVRAKGDEYRISFQRVDLSKVARHARSMPSSYINRAGNNVTKAFLDYAHPIVGPLPIPGRLAGELAFHANA